MLILTRRVAETITIGGSITVTVLGVQGNQVRLGISAPRDVGVHREEIYARIQSEETDNDRTRNDIRLTPKHSVSVRVKKSTVPR